jgi:hypothetical protein
MNRIEHLIILSHYPQVRMGGSMLPQGEEGSFRKLVRVETQSFRGWGCSECAWVFHPSDPPIGKSLDEMKRNFQIQLSQQFASHDCTEHPTMP